MVVSFIILALALAAFWWKRSRTAREDPVEAQDTDPDLYEEIDETNWDSHGYECPNASEENTMEAETNLDSHHDEENEADTTDIQPQTSTQPSTTGNREIIGEAIIDAIPLSDMYIQPTPSEKQGTSENNDPSGYNRLSFQVKETFEEKQESDYYHKLDVIYEIESRN